MSIALEHIDPNSVDLSHEEIKRYSRHLIMPEVGMKGQKKLKAASVLLIGTGGLGSPLAMYLAAAGVGRIGLVDYDTVDASNLQRQVVHGTSTIGKLKVESAKERILDINPDIRVDTYNDLFTSANAFDIARPYDIIIDGTDNFPTRYLVNDVCVLLKKPMCMVQFSDSRDRRRSFGRSTDLVTVVCFPSRHRRDWCRRAPKAACSACYPERLARFRRRKRSS